jgi:hypothetical protein
LLLIWKIITILHSEATIFILPLRQLVLRGFVRADETLFILLETMSAVLQLLSDVNLGNSIFEDTKYGRQTH